MTDSAGTKERRRDGGARPALEPPGTGFPGEDAEALFKEARRRRRRRRLVAVLGLVLALVAAVVGLQVSGGGTNRPPARAAHGGAPRVYAGPGPNTGAGLAGFTPPAVEVMGQADRQLVWAAGIGGLYLTSDGGAHWRTVTPPNLAHQYVAERVITLEAVGQDDLWLVLYDVPGLVPYSASQDGSDRGEGIDRSTDGGRTWTFSTLPGCIQLCGPTALSFVDANHGVAVVSADDGNPHGQPALLFTTADGGASWRQVATPPDLGAVAMDGPAPDEKLVFTSARDGWAVSGPLEGPDATTSNAGGVVYRTTDGGTTWSTAPGLPSGAMTLPTFFGPEDGVVLRDPEPPSKVQPSAYVTHDGGATWSPVALPAAAVGPYKGGASLSGRFSAASPTHWFVVDDTTLYTTTDVGRHWTTTVSAPAFQASSALFASDHDGVALGQFAHCGGAASAAHPTPPSCYPLLVMTSDGGRHWREARV
jgi:photosystem II stability/assembly factor-like uncharacterized protein